MSWTKAIGRTTRAVVVTLSLTAWFVLSNHCAIGGVAPVKQGNTDSCPMHSAPAKKKPETKTPCCKEVRALVVKCLTVNTAGFRLIGTREYATEIFAEPVRLAIATENLDTGPPGCSSFAESVLQESLFSHAPPLS